MESHRELHDTINLLVDSSLDVVTVVLTDNSDIAVAGINCWLCKDKVMERHTLFLLHL